MQYNIFISYASPDTDIVENLRDNFKRHGVNAWLYSLDRTSAADAWKEIESKIKKCDLLIFVVSKNTLNAKGQQQELKLALGKVTPLSGISKIMPIFITGTGISDLPQELLHKNGHFLDGSKVKSVALKIVKDVFPSLVKIESEKPWRYPIPAEWLEVSNLDEFVEEDFDIGDKLYFRTISPMGLFECYAPNIKGLFWIAHENVRPFKNVEAEKVLEAEVPMKFRVSGMIEIQRRGWKAWNTENEV